MKPPEPSLNGGLYTGTSFIPNAPWGNVPVIPDTGYMIHYNLRSANPPPGAIYQYPGSNRPGNSWTPMHGIQKYNDNRFNLYCIDEKEKEIVSNININKNQHNNKFSKYFYLN
jgi:hypothetical protein